MNKLATAFAAALLPYSRSQTARAPYWDDSSRALLRALFIATAYRYAEQLAYELPEGEDSTKNLTMPACPPTSLLLTLFEEICHFALDRTDPRSAGTLPAWVYDLLPPETVSALESLLSRNALVTAACVSSGVTNALESIRDLASYCNCDRVFHPETTQGIIFAGVEGMTAESLRLLLLAAEQNGVTTCAAYEVDSWAEDLANVLVGFGGEIVWTAAFPSPELEGLLQKTQDISWGFASDCANKAEFERRVQRTTGQPGGLLTFLSSEEPGALSEKTSLRYDGFSWGVVMIPEPDNQSVDLLLEREGIGEDFVPFQDIFLRARANAANRSSYGSEFAPFL
jgi:hypothetical protein